MYNKIDYTLLKPFATKQEIVNLCKIAIEKGCASVCIPSHYVHEMHTLFPELTICTVIGFPFGNCTTATKTTEAWIALTDGAKEIDMVINISEVKNHRWDYVLYDIKRVVEEAKYHQAIVKVILETCYLTEAEIVKCCLLASEAGADFVKTSTGYGTAGADFKTVELMVNTCQFLNLKVKASGGIKTREEVEKYLALGVDRIGMSKLF